MTDDIVKRLRESCGCNIDSTPCCAESACRDALEAADTITALRAEVERLTVERDYAMMSGHDLAKEEYREKLQAAEAERDRQYDENAHRIAEQAKAEAERDRLREALVIAEAALADIGDADREPGDDLAWCECRARKALPRIRATLAATRRAALTTKGEANENA